MMKRNVSTVKKREYFVKNFILILGILLVSFNLRPAITSVGPLINYIRDDMGISNGVAGFITTLPLLSFALFSLVAPKLGHRFGNERMVFAGLLLLLFGIVIRHVGYIYIFFLGTALIGIGIALANVLLPSIVKSKFPAKLGVVTGLYTTSLSGFSALGTGLSIPLAEGLQLGWENALLFWGGLVIIAMLIWSPQIFQRHSDVRDNNVEKKMGKQNKKMQIWRSPLAWQVTFFMGLQSLIFFSIVTWLPTILSNSGMNLSIASIMVSVLQFSTLPMTFFTPMLAARTRSQYGLVVFISSLFFIGFIGLMVAKSMYIFIASAILIGLALGAALSLGLTFFGLRAENGEEAAELSGMAQSFGYLLAGLGPFIIGFVLDMTTSNIVPFLFFIIVTILLFVFGLGAARDRTVFQTTVNEKKLMTRNI